MERKGIDRERRMERKGIVICTIVGLLGILTAVFGFAAEAKRIKGSEVTFLSRTVCVFPRSSALTFGLTATLSLVISQIMITVAADFRNCKRSPSNCIFCLWRQTHQSQSNLILALLRSFSALSFLIALFMLLLACTTMYLGYYCSCEVVPAGVFLGASVLSLASVILAIFYYIGSVPSSPNQISSIAMG